MRGSRGYLLSSSTSDPGSRTGSGRNISPLISVNTVVVAPMPRASDTTATTVDTGVRAMVRKP
jgi:hypothetical protein